MIDWQPGPHNRWAFQKIDEIVPTLPITRGSAPVDPLIRDLPRFERMPGLGVLDLASRHPVPDVEHLITELTATSTDALLVARRGQLVLEHYDKGMTPATRHLLMSVSKVFAGMLAGQAIEAGLIDESAPVTTYVPELASSAYGTATVRDVLDMVVAVQFSEDYADPRSEVQRQDRAAGWRDRREGDPADSYEFLQTLRVSGAHGEHFQYCSADTDVLGWILERATDMPYATLLESAIWQRLGVASDAFITVDPGGFPMANGGLCTTARDLLVFGQALLERRDPLPATWLTGTLEGGDPTKALREVGDVLPGASYRGHVWHLGDGRFMGWGIYSQYLVVDPAQEIVIVKFSTEPEAVTENSRKRHIALFDEITRLVTAR